MNELISQVKRLWSDDGRNDKDFSKQDLQLKEAMNRFFDAIDNMKAASDHLREALSKID